MENIYICPKCNNQRSLENCSCGYKINNLDKIYHFLDDSNYTSDFDKIGKFYNTDKENLILDAVAENINNVLNEGVVLDLGSGDGLFTNQLLKYNYKLISIDNSLVMLGKLINNVKNNHENLRVLRADARNIPLIDCSVDLVIANNLLHLVDIPELVIKEMKRVLKTGGMYVQISDGQNSVIIKESSVYDEIINYYTSNYWKLMNEYGFKPKVYPNDFNMHLHIGKEFSFLKSNKTEEFKYSGILRIKDFFNKELFISEYSKIDIPDIIHKKVYDETRLLIEEEFGKDYVNLETRYTAISSSIIDIYKK